MATDVNNPSEVRERLYKEIDDARYGMLGVIRPEQQHLFNPMACYPEKENGRIWFFTTKGNDLVKDSGPEGRMAIFIVTSGQEFQASVGGNLREQYDRSELEKFWNPHIAAWYPNGKDDPNLTMLCFEPHDADVWISRSGPVKYAFEVAKANATHSTPNVTGKTSVQL